MIKTLNNEANKARFFSLYAGQKCAILPDDFFIYTLNGKYIHEETANTFLSLRSISSLADEEIRECHRLMKFSGHVDYINTNELLATIVTGMEMGALWQVCADYLRSIGILIPWLDLSVEQIIQYGWAKEDSI